MGRTVDSGASTVDGSQAAGGAGCGIRPRRRLLTGNDILRGGDGSDQIYMGAGNDVLDGGTGIDTLKLEGHSFNAGANPPWTVDLRITTAQDTHNGLDTISGFEDVLGTDGADHIVGAAGINHLWGGIGADYLDGDGNDTLNCGTGRDSALYETSTAGVTVNLGLSGAQNTVGAGTDTLNSIEDFWGSAFNDTLTGGAGDNSLRGGAGDDVLRFSGGATPGQDYMDGGDGYTRPISP
jgi:Ca2+-binding RTX toxin-like protein